MTAARILLVVSGVAVVMYGAVLVLEFQPRTLVLIVVWAGAGVLLHDFVFAPVAAALGWVARRWIRGDWWPPVAIAALCSAVLVLVAVPVYDRPGAKPDNPSALDRNYPLGLAISLAVVWACVLLYNVIAVWLRRRRRIVDTDQRSLP